MKNLIVFFSIFYFNQSLACDWLSPRVELDEAKESIEYESVSTFIPTLLSREEVSIKNKPDWIYFHAPKEINNKVNYYSIELRKSKAPKVFTLSILVGSRLLELKLKLAVKDPAPNRKLTEFEKACGRISYSSVKYL
jgi:hypothetical protein